MLLANHVRAIAGAPACAGCRAPGRRLCIRCARSLRPAAATLIPEAEQVIAAWEYEGAARSLVLDLKLRGRRDAAVPLVDAMVTRVRAVGTVGSVVAWVPGRSGDLRRRGFDHAAILASGLSRALGLPLTAALTRLADPPDQAALGRRERGSNVVGAFGGRGCRRPILLVDDVITTGATVTECVKVLRESAPSVDVVVPCRRGG